MVSTHVCTNRVSNGIASANQGYSTASQGSCHVHGTHAEPPTMGVAGNEAEETGASSLFCVRMHARIGDVL